MNANPLNKYYDRLKVWERIRLLFAAHERGDDIEAELLLSSSPRRAMSLPEHLLTEQALHVLALIYVGEQLDAAAHYFFSLWQGGEPEEPHPEEWLRAAQAEAYFFTANADAFRCFCSELGVSAEALTAANHRGRFLRYCEEHMPANAPSVTTVQAWPRQAAHEAARVTTSDNLLESWRRTLRAITPHAP